jgi:hypothetical protein
LAKVLGQELIEAEPRCLYVESPYDPDNSLTAVPLADGGVSISVSDEQAVDSYNATFECDIDLSREGLTCRDRCASA